MRWAKEIESGKDDEDKSSFLAWQVHILHVKTIVIPWIVFFFYHRPGITVYGFKGLIEDFSTDHPGYCINPRWLNGSAVETLFAQLKHTTGHLSAANYATAKATPLTKPQAKGKDEYRSAELYLRQLEQGNLNQVTMTLCILTNAWLYMYIHTQCLVLILMNWIFLNCIHFQFVSNSHDCIHSCSCMQDNLLTLHTNSLHLASKTRTFTPSRLLTYLEWPMVNFLVPPRSLGQDWNNADTIFFNYEK